MINYDIDHMHIWINDSMMIIKVRGELVIRYKIEWSDFVLPGEGLVGIFL